ncbi:MAG: hypothetical protein JXQ71_04355 [Verrucomicrobia bacterium]|nr:hypothetical protein [Verrucomicrobiota bacterium]
MKTQHLSHGLAFVVVLALACGAHAQPILSLDVDERGVTPITHPGFESFLITSDGGTAAQTAPTTRNFGALSVTLSLGGGAANYDDRQRDTPVDSGEFTQSLLLRDFVFCGSSTPGTGLDVTVDGLTPHTAYRFTIWSFDTGSTGNRVSDWSVSGIPVVEDYVFNGSILPTNNTHYQFSFKAPADAGGQVVIQGRRDAATPSAGSVFINALQIEPATADPPPGAFSITPLNPAASSGSTVTFSASGYDPTPLLFQWQRSDGGGGFTNIPAANAPSYTTASLLMSDDASQFRCVASNPFGSTPSDLATLTVYEDTNAPTVLNVQTEYPYTDVVVTFSEPVIPGEATDWANYYLEIEGQVMFTNISMLDDRTVWLRTDQTMQEGQSYTLMAANIHDLSPLPNMLAETSFVFTAVTCLSIDFNERGDTATTQPLFNPFEIDSEGSATQIQSNATTRAFGTLQVSLSGAGANAGYDDRLRTTPVNQGAFTESMLLRDFVFSRTTTTGEGLDVRVAGLTGGATYQFTVWSFDSVSSGSRVSDWSADGWRVKDNHVFNGSQLPTNNSQYQFSFKTTAPPSGEVLIAGRRDNSTTSGELAVFINALRLEVATPDPVAILQNPTPVTVYAGGHAIFSAQLGGTPPFGLQWQKGGEDVPGETNLTLVVYGAQADDAGLYRLMATNAGGTATSSDAQLDVLPVDSLTTGLIAHWPLDALAETTPDLTPFAQDLTTTNLEPANLVGGMFGSAFEFNGTNALAWRQDTEPGGLPAVAYPAYTVALWVKGVGVGQSDRRVFAESANTNNTPLLTVGTAVHGTNGTVDIYIRNNNNTAPVNHLLSGLEAFDGAWHHIAWVDNNGYGRIYVDGIPDTNEVVYPRGVLTPNVVTVGGLVRAEPSHWFTGSLDDVAVWSRSLSQAEIQQVMQHGLAPKVEILTIQLGAGELILTFDTTQPAATHQIVARADLADPWTEVAEAQFESQGGSRMTAAFPTPPARQMFYGVRLVP